MLNEFLKYVTIFVLTFCFPSPMLAQYYYTGVSMNKSTTKLYSEIVANYHVEIDTAKLKKDLELIYTTYREEFFNNASRASTLGKGQGRNEIISWMHTPDFIVHYDYDYNYDMYVISFVKYNINEIKTRFPQTLLLKKKQLIALEEALVAHYGFASLPNLLCPKITKSTEEMVDEYIAWRNYRHERYQKEQEEEAKRAQAAREAAENEKKIRKQKQNIENTQKQLGNVTATIIKKSYQAWGNSTKYTNKWEDCSVPLHFNFSSNSISIDDIDGVRRTYRTSGNWKYYDHKEGWLEGFGIFDRNAINLNNGQKCEIIIQKGSRYGLDVWVLEIIQNAEAQESSAYFFRP